MRLGRCALNHYLYQMKLHPTGTCHTCGEKEDIEHYLLKCKESKFKDIFTHHKINLDLNSVLNSKLATDLIFQYNVRKL